MGEASLDSHYFETQYLSPFLDDFIEKLNLCVYYILSFSICQHCLLTKIDFFDTIILK
nr:MAG TPA: hypothetical protein [Caudoviricetes sp.]